MEVDCSRYTICFRLPVQSTIACAFARSDKKGLRSEDVYKRQPLGKAEWLVALSEVIGKRAEGEKVCAEIPVRYNVLKKKVSDNSLDAPSVDVYKRQPESIDH